MNQAEYQQETRKKQQIVQWQHVSYETRAVPTLDMFAKTICAQLLNAFTSRHWLEFRHGSSDDTLLESCNWLIRRTNRALRFQSSLKQTLLLTKAIVDK
jgi:hypothetical protein